MSPLKTIIVDDKWLIRSELKFLLSKYPNIDVVGEAENAEEAITLISEQKPDAVFLDIHLPEYSGFDLIDKLNIDCKIIFISAYNKYRTAAKKYHPIEFLVKPISAEKLSRTIKKLEKVMAFEGGE